MWTQKPFFILVIIDAALVNLAPVYEINNFRLDLSHLEIASI